ncbi:MAG TPA: hypothetical protein PK490_19970 [Prosthecobacter sp.]|nr:hypothetical protein [Prosthecobacter sp.]
MSLATAHPFQHSCSGDAAAFGSLSEVVDRIEDFLRHALPMIVGKMSGWTGARRKNEKSMAADLGKELDFAATNELFHFHSEDPENESATRTMDYGVYPTALLQVRGWSPNARHRLYGMEAKRLPTTIKFIESMEREREYVVGDWDARSSVKKRLTGGIERFKECAHAADLERAGMIGFIQSEDANHWQGKVNEWVEELCVCHLPRHQAIWSAQDLLAPTMSPGASVAVYESSHVRSNGTLIRLSHFWLNLSRSET